jgi:hypothetical protein
MYYWFKFAGPTALSEFCGGCHQRVEALEVARVHDLLHLTRSGCSKKAVGAVSIGDSSKCSCSSTRPVLTSKESLIALPRRGRKLGYLWPIVGAQRRPQRGGYSSVLVMVRVVGVARGHQTRTLLNDAQLTGAAAGRLQRNHDYRASIYPTTQAFWHCTYSTLFIEQI